MVRLSVLALVDSGTHTGNAAQAAKDALQAYQQAFAGRKAAAENDAKTFIQTTHCDGDCGDNGTMIIGPFQSTQEWDINIHVEPNFAQTWCWIGYLGIVFCKKAG
jgi:hypothetical protein